MPITGSNTGLSYRTISWSRLVVRFVFLRILTFVYRFYRLASYLDLDKLVVQLDFNRLGTSEWIKLGLRLKSSRILLLRVFSLYGFIVVYSFLGLELLFISVVCEKSAIESTGYCTIHTGTERGPLLTSCYNNNADFRRI